MVKTYKVKIKNIPLITVGGFETGFPQELIGVVGVKEYLEAIDNINSNAIRDYNSYILIMFAVGLLPGVIMLFVNMVRWPLFKSRVRKDLKPVIENINKVMSLRGVTFKIKYGMDLTCTISYPDVPVTPTPGILPSTSVVIDGQRTALLLEPCFEPHPLIKNPRKHWQPLEPIDTNFKSIFNPYVPINFLFNGIKGWKKEYNDQLYNYISNQEYNEMIDDYNSRTTEPVLNKNCANFFFFSCFTMLLLIGFILVIPAGIWFNIELKKYNSKVDKICGELNVKYLALYGVRGISIGQVRPDVNQRALVLTLTVPRDVGHAPVLTNLLPSKQLLLAPTIPGGIAPYYQFIQQPQQVQLYQIQPIQ